MSAKKKIIGVTVGTPLSPDKINDKLKPVKTVNGKTPDATGNVEIPSGVDGRGIRGSLTEYGVSMSASDTPTKWYADIPTVQDDQYLWMRVYFIYSDGTYTTHPIRVDRGKDGIGIKSVARTSGNGSAGTTDTYTITYTDNSTSTFTVYNGKNGTNGTNGTNGKDGTSVTVTNVSESDASGGSNVVNFSDGKTLTVKNGKDGTDGKNGENEQIVQIRESQFSGGENEVYFKYGTKLTIRNGYDGTDGKSAYQYAKEGGYAGTEADYKNDSNPDNIKAELEQIEAPMIVSSVAEMTDTTKHYVNQNTGTIWANITGTSTEVTENNEYNASYTTGLNLRLSTNDGTHRTGANGRYTTDYIEITPSSPYTVTLKGLSVPLVTVDDSYCFVYYFDVNKNYLGYAGMGTLGNSPASGALPMSFNIAKYSNFSSAKYVRITLHLSTSTAITTENLNGLVINFAPKNTTTTSTEKTWSDTGITYAPTFKTDLIGVLGEGDVIYLSDNLPSGKTYTLKYPDNNYATIGTITK